MKRSATTLIWFSLALLLASLLASAPSARAVAWEPPSEPPEIPLSSPFLASAIHAIVCPDGSVVAQALFLAPNYTLRVRGIEPGEVGYPDRSFPYPHGLEVLALWARKGSPMLWGGLGGFLSGQGWPWGDGFSPFSASAPHRAGEQPFQPPDKEKMMSMLYSPGLWLGMFFMGSLNEQKLFEAKAEQLASSVSNAYGVDMWLYLSFTFPLTFTRGLFEGTPEPPWPKDYMGFVFVYYADAELEDVVDGFVGDLPDGTPCELVKNTTAISGAPYALLAYFMVDARLVALLNATRFEFSSSWGEHEPWPSAPLVRGDHDEISHPEWLEAGGWITGCFSEHLVISGLEKRPDGNYTLSLNALFGHSGPICAGGPPAIPEDMETLAILLVDIPWWMEVVSVEPEEANMTWLTSPFIITPQFITVFFKLKKGECVDDLLVVLRPRKSFPIVLLRQFADSYIVEPGGEATVTVCAENVGNATAYNVICIASYEEGPGRFREEVLELGDIPPGHKASASFTVRVPRTGPMVLEPAIATYFMAPSKSHEYVFWTELEDTFGPFFWCESNSIRFLTQGEEAPSLLAFLEFDRYIVRPGEPIEATLTIKNVGNAPAEDITIDGIISSFWGSWGAYGGGVSHYYYGEIGYVERIGPGEEVRLNLTVPEKALKPVWEETLGPIFGSVEVAFCITPEGEGGVWSNTARAIVMAKAEDMWQLGLPYVIVEKSASKTHVKRGEVFTITLHVSNVGTAEAHDIVIVEKLPHGLTFVGNARSHPDKEFTATAEAAHVVIHISSLAPGETVDISFDVRADKTGTYVLASSLYQCETSIGTSVKGFSEMLVVVVEEPGFTPEALITPMALGAASIIATLAIGLYLTKRRSG